jgi:archaellum biogenesis ATPase FlaH
MNVNNESLLLSFFNQYLFNEAKQNIEHIEYFYQTTPSTSGNPFIKELIDSIKNYNLDAIGEPLFRSILARGGKTQQEADQLMSEILKWKQYNREEIAPAAKDMRDVISTAIIRKASARFGNSSTDFLKYLKNVNVSTGDGEMFSSTSFDKIDINTLIADSKDSCVATNVDLINRAYASCGYKIPMSQLVVIAATPGSGKTLFAMNLALWFASIGKKTLYTSLADMNLRDFVTRLGSIAFNCSFAESFQNTKEIYENLTKITGSNLEISINSAGTVTADQIVEKAMNDNFDVVFVDYDGVLKTGDGKSADESMYNAFGDAYNKLTALSVNGKKLVFICSQLKVTSNQGGNLISLSDLAESSKKGQIVDAVIAMSKISGPDCPHQLFDIRFTKCRRGRVGTHGTFIRNQARFIEIPRGLAEQLKMETEDREYTDQQIQAMAERYKQSEQVVNQAIKQEQKRHDNPFS